MAKADAYRNAGDYGRAIQEYSKAANELGSDASSSLGNRIAVGAYNAGLKLERQHIASGSDLDAEALAFRVAFDLDPGDGTYKQKLAKTNNTIGNQFLAESKYAEAADAYREAYDLYPGDVGYERSVINAHRLDGDRLLARHQFAEAITAYRSAYKVDMNNQTSKSKLAAAYNDRGMEFKYDTRYTKAVADFKEAMALEPTNKTYQINYLSLISHDR